MNKKQLDKMMKEVKKMYYKKEKSNKGLWIGIGIAVIAALVGLVLWLKSKNDEDIEEYYEYFDDEIEEDLEDDLYGEEDDDVEYYQIKNFDETEVEEDAEDETV